MKILHVYKTFLPENIGGVEVFIRNLAAALTCRGIQSDVLCVSEKKNTYHYCLNGQNIYFFPSIINIASCPISLSLLIKFKSIVSKYDVIHYHFPWPFADFLHLFSRIKKPTIVTYHSDVVRQKFLNILYAPLMHRFLKNVKVIVATSENYLRSSQVLAKYAQKSRVIPFGMSHKELPLSPEKILNEWREKVGENFFLFVGVFRYYKGLVYLLEALKGTSIPCVIVGDGHEAQSLKMIVDKNQLNVQFVGSVSEEAKAALYQLSRAVIIPSHLRSEAFCISLLEGLLFNKPLISCEINTGTSFVNQHNISGIVVPPENAIALREAMQKIMNDELFYQGLKKSALVHYKQYFTIEKMAESYLEAYLDIV